MEDRELEEVCLNLGCGYNKLKGFINVDAYEICKPDIVWDLDRRPWPWDDNSVDHIAMFHVLEHIKDWWEAIEECARILKVGGSIDLRVPDESESSAGTYRDHHNIFTWYSFYGIDMAGISAIKMVRGTNAWAHSQKILPLIIIHYYQVPYKKYRWMAKWCPKLLTFCADHLRNFIWEQIFIFVKIGGKTNERS